MVKFYKEIKTGSIIASIEELDTEKYEALEPNTVDAALEKHVPIYEVDGDEIIVRVGETLHPMLDEHYIVFIALVNGHNVKKVDLYPGDEPIAKFDYVKGSEIYAYCNLHELWKADVK